ncbi:MAG: hypothetical protein EHM32_08400 [Spirochaetales bacterium]|nr:MAG: hypothetical protein EHM32_08400 [Spirochaetales bacterium]
MEYDLHIHTSRYSGCSNIDPVSALRRASEIGLRGIALSEHGIRWRDDEVQELISEAGVSDLVVFPGQEIACYSSAGRFQGEFLVFGYPSSLGSNKSAERLVDMVHENGGVVVAAHPYKPHGTGHGYYGSGDDTANYALDGVEVEHPSYDDGARGKALSLARRMGVSEIGCSDAHDIRNIGICRTILESDVVTVEGLCEELKRRRTRAIHALRRESA